MAEEPRALPLGHGADEAFSGLRWRWIMGVVAALLLLFLVLLAYLDSVFTDLSHWSLWRNFLDAPF